MEQFSNYLGDIDHLVDESYSAEKDVYIHPKLKNMGCVILVVIREAIAPVIFKNLEEEITDIEHHNETYIRAVPNKFKYPERSCGLQILRAYGVGGRMPQNRTIIPAKGKPSDAYDLNTLVFGDSAMQLKRILPVRSGFNYSDGLSLKPKYTCVDETFHIRTTEDGTLFDAEEKKNSENLFTRHFITPGTLMIQVISTRGRVVPREALDHLLLSIGMAGSYGGATSTTGVNIKTHLVGLYGARLERSIASPYEIIKKMSSDMDKSDPDAVISSIHKMVEKEFEVSMAHTELCAYQNHLIQAFESNDKELSHMYEKASGHIRTLFDSWFETIRKPK